MSMSLKRAAGSGNTLERSARWAWLALLLSPVFAVLAIAVGFGMGEDTKWWGDLIVVGLALVPPIAAFALGVWAARTGNRVGALAAAVGAAWLTFVIVFFVGANSVWTGESSVWPLTLAAIAGVLVGAAVETHWSRPRKTGAQHV